MKILKILSISSFIFFLCSCSSQEKNSLLLSLPFPFKENGQLDRPSQRSICETRNEILKFKKGDYLERNSEGIILLEGRVTHLSSAQDNKANISFLVSDVLVSPSNDKISKNINIITPIDFYGVETRINETYRVLVMFLEGKYYLLEVVPKKLDFSKDCL